MKRTDTIERNILAYHPREDYAKYQRLVKELKIKAN
jgi:hypothetical protein